ncbi:ribonuclease Z [Prevotella sp. KH2C16]|uniref:ribonuclease Z n=1 Tax=Prevotella sp. KH2C16 TaxID=1855325 RepID=UPI0008E22BBF|nr:ribonuclease Z [Prevotella sp. KH2C16]SFF98449.1 ribonuclease Z [Prevotella sp. KH2C16]
MEPFKVHILGCGSALPTLKHFSSSQVVEVREKLFMVDCGEGTQIQLRKTRLRFTKIGCVFISHLHGDHCFGLIGLISTFGMLGRTVPLHVYAPKELEPMLHAQMEMFCRGLEFEVVFHAVDTTKNQVIFDDKSLAVETIPLQHRVPCCGFLFREKPGRRHILRDMIDCYEIPVSQIDNIKSGMDWTTSDGQVIPNSRLTADPSPVRSYAYCSDTRYIPSLHKLVEGVNLLYHESTYDKTCAERAKLYYHSTAEQAAMVARDARAGQLLLGHFSARYNDEEQILNEAKVLFPNTYLACEGKTFDVK